jgi:hypothetical protein
VETACFRGIGSGGSAARNFCMSRRHALYFLSPESSKALRRLGDDVLNNGVRPGFGGIRPSLSIRSVALIRSCKPVPSVLRHVSRNLRSRSAHVRNFNCAERRAHRSERRQRCTVATATDLQCDHAE